MSRGASTAQQEEPSTTKKAYRTVTPPYFGRPDAEMTVIGIAYFLGLVVLLVPLLPFLAIIWLASKVIDRYRGDATQ
jgi:hypothetical protein